MSNQGFERNQIQKIRVERSEVGVGRMKEFIQEYWVEVLFGIITSAMGYGLKRLTVKVNEQEAIKMGVQALLRDRIIESYNKHCERGFCPIYARENIQEMANQYYNLGGNGVVPNLIDKLLALPTEYDKKGDTK